MKTNRAKLQAFNIAEEICQKLLVSQEPLEFEEPPDVSEIEYEEESDGEAVGWDGEDREDELDALVRPTRLDNVIYRFTQYRVVKFLLNKEARKIYAVKRISDNKDFVIIVARDVQLEQEQCDLPREVIVMTKVKDDEYVANIHGWCRVDPYVFAILMDYYVDVSFESLFGCASAIRDYMWGLLSGLLHIHECGVAHRDMAPQNVLWNPVTSKPVIIDFEWSCLIRDNGFLREVGRPEFDAPEKCKVFKEIEKENYKFLKPYNEQSEIFSVGIIFYMLLYKEKRPPSVMTLNRQLQELHNHRQSRRRPELDLLMKLLAYDPRKRISLKDALEHDYFKMEPADSSQYQEMRTILCAMVEVPLEEDKEEDDQSENEGEEEEGDIESEEEEESKSQPITQDSRKETKSLRNEVKEPFLKPKTNELQKEPLAIPLLSKTTPEVNRETTELSFIPRKIIPKEALFSARVTEGNPMIHEVIGNPLSKQEQMETFFKPKQDEITTKQDEIKPNQYEVDLPETDLPPCTLLSSKNESEADDDVIEVSTKDGESLFDVPLEDRLRDLKINFAIIVTPPEEPICHEPVEYPPHATDVHDRVMDNRNPKHFKAHEPVDEPKEVESPFVMDELNFAMGNVSEEPVVSVQEFRRMNVRDKFQFRHK